MNTHIASKRYPEVDCENVYPRNRLPTGRWGPGVLFSLDTDMGGKMKQTDFRELDVEVRHKTTLLP